MTNITRNIFLLFGGILWLLMGPVGLKAQYIFSKELNFSTYSQATNIQEFGDNYLVEVHRFFTDPFSYRESTGVLNINDEFVSLTDYLPNSLEGFRFSKQLVLTDELAVVCSAGELSSGARGYQLFMIDATGMSVRNTEFVEFESKVTQEILSFGVSGFSLIEQVTEPINSIYITHFSEDLDTLGGFSIAIEGANVNFIAANRNAEGDIYVVFDSYSSNGTNFQAKCRKYTSSGEELWELDLPYPHYSIEGYVAVEPYGDSGVAVLEGYGSGSGLGCPVTLCPGEGDIVGALSVFESWDDVRELYELKFYPFGMVKDSSGELIIYGSKLTGVGEKGAVFFKPSGWLGGGLLRELLPPLESDFGVPLSNLLRKVRIIQSENILIGAGRLDYGDSVFETDWFFGFDLNCLSSSCSEFIDLNNDLVSIENSEQEITVAVFPNPFVDHLEISTSSPLPKPVKVTLMNGIGQELQTRFFQERLSWNLGGLLPGVYYAVFSQEGRSVVRKVVKR
jgi:hypothetical protein